MGKKSKRRAEKNAPTSRQIGQQPIRGNHLPTAHHVRAFSTPIQMPFVTDSLVMAVFERRGLPQHLDSFEELKTCLSQAFTGFAELSPFFQALAKGLEDGQPLINKPVQLVPQNPDKMPLLHWICQYRFLNHMLGCHLSDDVVGLVLKAGADPNAIRVDNRTTPLFFAVKYGSLQTLDMLLAAGANIHHRDCFGQTCLKNALEHPKPMMIRRLLGYLPATEMIKSSNGQWMSREFLISTADMLLGLATSEVPPVSWVNLGVPATDDILEAFMMIRLKGARLTQRGSGFLVKAISFSVENPTHPQIKHPTLLQKFAQVLVGTYIPKSVRPQQEINETSASNLEQDDVEPDKCPICLENVRKSITLYCGHTFCRECILEHGKNGADCPMCRVPLSRDVSANGGGLAFTNLMGIDTHHAFKRWGPKFFTDEQVDAESRAQGIYSYFSSYASLRNKLETTIENGRRNSREMIPFEMNGFRNVEGGGHSTNPSGSGRCKLELASNITVVLGTPPSVVSMHPRNGMVSIEVSINDIPLLARISNQSLYTVLSKSMVDKLGLKRIDTLKSRKFVDFQGKKIRNGSTFTCLEPVKICFQGIEVTLRNAIEISDTPQFMMTVQLGQDFLCSGRLSVIDVEVGESESNYHRVVTEDSWPVSGVSKESFRYYSHDGKMADLPLIHFDPFQGAEGVVLTISLKESVKFDQCNWCCRGFPEGMLKCGGCMEAFYCDERCQKGARRIHKLTCGIQESEE